MSDRELLELAAKAAGYQSQGFDDADRMYLFGIQYPWNPLTDDGDALRLAVKLRFHICPISMVTIATIKCPHHIEIWREDDENPLLDFYWTGGDAYESTRRAIVRAAAELGRNTAKGDGGGI